MGIIDFHKKEAGDEATSTLREREILFASLDNSINLMLCLAAAVLRPRPHRRKVMT